MSIYKVIAICMVLAGLAISGWGQDVCPSGSYSDTCYCNCYNVDYDTSLMDADTVRMVVHVFGTTDSTNYTADSIDIDNSVAFMNYTWAGAKLTWVYTINWLPNTAWRTTHPLTSAVNPNQTTNDAIIPQVMLAPDSQMQVYVHSSASTFGTISTTTGAEQAIFMQSIDSGTTLSHECGHGFGLLHTHQAVGYSAGGSWPGCAGDHAEVSSLADSTTEERATDSSRYANGDYCKDTKADPGFGADSLPNISVDSCTGLAWGLEKTDALNVMSYTCELCQLQMTADQARIVRCWLETNYPGWIRHE